MYADRSSRLPALVCVRGARWVQRVQRSGRAGWRPALALIALFGTGCSERAATTATPATSQSTENRPVVLTTPQDATRSLLTCLRAELDAIARKDPAAAEHCRTQVLGEIAAHDELTRRLERRARLADVPVNQVVRDFTSNWAAAIAFYAPGIDFDHITVPPVSEAAKAAIVLVPAEARQRRATIQVECLRGADGLWRVTGIDLAVPNATQPVTSAPIP